MEWLIEVLDGMKDCTDFLIILGLLGIISSVDIATIVIIIKDFA